MARVLVLGAGFGGIPAAIELRARLDRAHDVVLVDQGGRFLMGLSKLWALDGRRPLAQGQRRIQDVTRHGVDVKRGIVEAIDVAAARVTVKGEPLPYDRLVIALGAELAPEAIPGFEAAHNLYQADAIPALHEALADFEGGRVLFAIAGVPFKCPPAPYEAAILAAGLLERRGVRERCQVELSTPEPRPLPVAPPSCSNDLKQFLDANRIAYAPDHKPRRVHPQDRVVEYENGASKPYDLLVGVPVHRAPRVVRDAGLTGPSGWIPVDPHTLQTRHAGVYAIGDVAGVTTPSGKPLAKAGVFAEAQARVVAANIADEMGGGSPAGRFDGRGACFIEVGDGVATAIEGDFFHPDGPQLTMALPTREGVERKEAFEAERLQAWFGA